jgi:tetratricopeptide (TPR) repeat protein
MRIITTALFFSCCLLMTPRVSSAISTDQGHLSVPQFEGLLYSEFAFQSGEFARAFSYYKNRPMNALTPEEWVRGSQLAVVSGDVAWVQQLLNMLDHALQDNALILGLDDADWYRFYLYALQWQKDDLAEQLLKRMHTNSSEAKVANLIRVCGAKDHTLCNSEIAALDPQDFDILEQRAVWSIAQQSGLDQQTYRWLMQQTQDGNSYYQRIVLLSQQFDVEKALGLTSEIVRDADLNGFQRSALLGSLAELQKDWPVAEKQYRDAIAFNTPTTASLRLAIALFRQNKLSDALAWLANIQANTLLSDEIRREAFATEAQFQQMMGLDSEALQTALTDIYRRVLLIWPQAPAVRYQYAMHLFKQGQIVPALDQLRIVIKTTPADVQALNAYAYILAKEFNRPRFALQSIERAFLIAPNRAEVLDSYGYILHRLGRNGEALPALQKAWQLAPSAVTASHLAQVFLQMGDKQQARDYLKKGLALDKQETDLIKLSEVLL